MIYVYVMSTCIYAHLCIYNMFVYTGMSQSKAPFVCNFRVGLPPQEKTPTTLPPITLLI